MECVVADAKEKATNGVLLFYDGFYGELGLNDDHFDTIVYTEKKCSGTSYPILYILVLIV